MGDRLRIGEIEVDVVFKDVKNVHLSVYPPNGHVRITAPQRMSADTVRVFAISKIDWIRRQQRKLRVQERETPREYLERESHFVWGKRYLLQVVEDNGPARIELKHNTMVLRIRPGTDPTKRQEIVESWYREQVQRALRPLLAKWESRVGVKARRLFVRRMKTKWGSCNVDSGNIRLNTDLAKKPPECLEYVVVHELVHLLEPTHNARFSAFMDRLLPHWQVFQKELNSLPLRHEEWGL